MTLFHFLGIANWEDTCTSFKFWCDEGSNSGYSAIGFDPTDPWKKGEPLSFATAASLASVASATSIASASRASIISTSGVSIASLDPTSSAQSASGNLIYLAHVSTPIDPAVRNPFFVPADWYMEQQPSGSLAATTMAIITTPKLSLETFRSAIAGGGASMLISGGAKTEAPTFTTSSPSITTPQVDQTVSTMTTTIYEAVSSAAVIVSSTSSAATSPNPFQLFGRRLKVIPHNLPGFVGHELPTTTISVSGSLDQQATDNIVATIIDAGNDASSAVISIASVSEDKPSALIPEASTFTLASETAESTGGIIFITVTKTCEVGAPGCSSTSTSTIYPVTKSLGSSSNLPNHTDASSSAVEQTGITSSSSSAIQEPFVVVATPTSTIAVVVVTQTLKTTITPTTVEPTKGSTTTAASSSSVSPLCFDGSLTNSKPIPCPGSEAIRLVSHLFQLAVIVTAVVLFCAA